LLEIGPRTVLALGPFEIRERQLPDRRIDRRSGPFGLVQAEQRELRVRIIAATFARRVTPHARRRASADLGRFEPARVARDQEAVLFRFGRAEDHRLQGRRIGSVRLADRAKVGERGLDVW